MEVKHVSLHVLNGRQTVVVFRRMAWIKIQEEGSHLQNDWMKCLWTNVTVRPWSDYVHFSSRAIYDLKGLIDSPFQSSKLHAKSF